MTRSQQFLHFALRMHRTFMTMCMSLLLTAARGGPKEMLLDMLPEKLLDPDPGR
jgi:hypothetical protein